MSNRRNARGSPAHAGIDRGDFFGDAALPRFPRTRGDRPCLCHFAAPPSRLSSRPSETPDFQRSTDNGNLKNDISLLLPLTSLLTAILLNHPVRHPPSTASPRRLQRPPRQPRRPRMDHRPAPHQDRPPQRHRQRPQPRRRPPLHRAPDRQGHQREPQNPGSSNTSPTWPSNNLILLSKAHDVSRRRKLCPSTKSDKS